MSQLFASGGQSTRASASVLPVKIQGWFPLRLLVWSPCCSRDSQESSPAPQFKGIISSALSLLYGPTLTSIHDYHSFDYMDFCWQSNVSAFKTLSRLVITPLQYSCLENPMDGGVWWATVMGSQRVGYDWATSLHFDFIVSLYFWSYSPLPF